jgi:glycosyltransferase involved in cell wall biosynthesis
MNEPPIIKKVSGNVKRPLWSVMIPVYNCLEVLERTLRSVVSQDLGQEEMQIQVVDDCSTDGDVESLVQKVGKGRIEYVRQEKNGGSLKNFGTCINNARGQIVHLLHGDDIVYPGYYKKMTTLFKANPNAGAAISRFDYIDEEDQFIDEANLEFSNDTIIPDSLIWVASVQRIQYCSISVKREAYEQLGGFYGVSYGEDWLMWVRVASAFPILYTPEKLAAYRIRKSSISGNSILSGKNITDIKWVIEEIQKVLPASERKKVKKLNYKWYSYVAIDIAETLWKETKNPRYVQKQIVEAYKLNLDVKLVLKTGLLFTKIAVRSARDLVTGK